MATKKIVKKAKATKDETAPRDYGPQPVVRRVKQGNGWGFVQTMEALPAKKPRAIGR